MMGLKMSEKEFQRAMIMVYWGVFGGISSLSFLFLYYILRVTNKLRDTVVTKRMLSFPL